MRAFGGWICPRCRERSLTPPPREGIARCESDGFALVTAEAFADADGDPFLGLTVAGRYVVLGRLGAGSMGTVYRSRHEAMRRDVALKILRSDRALDAQAKARFTREARAMSLLTSPHTVTVFDFGEIPDPPPRQGELVLGGSSLYLAMELLEGEALGQRLKRIQRLYIDEAVGIARQALLSLAEAHDKGVIHRDLKPDNLFLTKAPSGDITELCKVLDFGIAKIMTDNMHVDALETQAGTVFGTPRYMSPEQAQGRPLDARSDLYALGVLLYQMLVGRPPFVDDDAVVVMARHIKTLPVAPCDAAPNVGVPRALSDLVMRALAKDPNERPPSAREFIAQLDRAMSQARGLVTTGPPLAAVASGEVAAVVHDDLTRRLVPRRSRRLMALGIGTSLVTLIAGLALVRVVSKPAPTPTAHTGVASGAERFVVSAAAAVGARADAPEASAPAADAAPVAPDARGPAAASVAPTPDQAPSAADPSTPSPAPPKGAPPQRPRQRTPYTRFE